jgi:hypothetical protein
MAHGSSIAAGFISLRCIASPPRLAQVACPQSRVHDESTHSSRGAAREREWSCSLVVTGLALVLDLGWNSRNIAATAGAGQKPRIRSIPARDTDAAMDEIRDAKRRFYLPQTTPVVSRYDAGRDRFGAIEWS